MPDIVQRLDDATAQRILKVIARSRTATGPEKINWTPDLRQSLVAEFDTKPATTPVSEGELTRQALLVLAEDPHTRNAIETMAATPQSLQKFDFGASLALTAWVLIVSRHTSHADESMIEKIPGSQRRVLFCMP